MNDYIKNISDVCVCIFAGIGVFFEGIPWGQVAGFLGTVLAIVRLVIEYPRLKLSLRKRQAVKKYKVIREEKERKKNEKIS